MYEHDRLRCAMFFGLVFLSAFFFRPVSAAELVDTDGDGLTDDEEIRVYHTDPNKIDTDGDDYQDGDEIKYGFSPLTPGKRLDEVDTDGDGLNDALEIALATDLKNSDTDADGYVDGVEVYAGFNPLKGAKDRSLPRRVEVDLTTQQLAFFLNNVKLGTMPVSTGLFPNLTPKGVFHILRKRPVVHYIGPGYNLPNTKWNLEFKRSYYLHGAYWHNQFGKRSMSHGCVNIAYKDVEGLYRFLDVGDEVKVVGVTPRGLVVKAKS